MNDHDPDFYRFYNKALNFLSYRLRSEQEVRDNLLRKNKPPNRFAKIPSKEIIEKIIIKLKDYKFIDDLEFSEWWIEQRLRSKPRSLRVLEMELKMKGISKDMIDKTINDLGLTNDDEIKSAKKLISKKVDKLKDLPREERIRKAAGMLGRRGFGWEIIKKVLKDSGLDQV